MKQRLGISIYPEKVGKNNTIEYINLAHENGFTRIFANLLEIKNNVAGNEKLKMLASIYTYASKLGFEVIVDVNPKFYKEFNLRSNELNFFKKLGVTGIRLDEDFNGEIESELSNNDFNFKIELNASATTKTIDQTIAKGGNLKNLIVCHNFYPMKYTALARDRFLILSTYFNAVGIGVAAFVTLDQKQNGVGPWNINEGMPSIEEHRSMSIEEQTRDLLLTGVVDDIIISQQGATKEQMVNMGQILTEHIALLESKKIDLKMELFKTILPIEKDIILNNHGNDHFNRPDYNSYFVRSTFPRVYYENDVIKPNNEGKKLVLGDIVILNEKLGRYKGEMHLILKNIDDSKSKSRNHVGKICNSDLNKLKYLKGTTKFSMVLKDE